MDNYFSQAALELLEDTKKVCSRYVDADSAAWDRGEKDPSEARKKMQELGYPMLTVPEEYGGPGISFLDVGLVLERIAYADAGLAVSLAGNALAVKAVMSAGSEAQKKEIAEILANGGIGAFCLTESQAGSEAFNILTKAVPEESGDGYVMNGTKLFVTNGGVADFYCVVAMDGESELPSLFLIKKGTEGLQIGPEEEKLGIRSCSTCSVSFENCHVDADALVEKEEGIDGAKAILEALNDGRLWISAIATGVALRAMDESIAYAKERIQFGKPIAEQQAIRMKLAEMKVRIEAAQSLTGVGLQMMQETMEREKSAAGDSAEEKVDDRIMAVVTSTYAEMAATAKAFAAEVAVEVTNKAVEIFGGYGYMNAYPVEKLLRDARVFSVLEGSREMMKIVIANALLKR